MPQDGRPTRTGRRKNPQGRIERGGDFCRCYAWHGLMASPPTTGERTMGKGNNSQKNDKKSMKPKQDKAKPAVKK